MSTQIGIEDYGAEVPAECANCDEPIDDPELCLCCKAVYCAVCGTQLVCGSIS